MKKNWTKLGKLVWSKGWRWTTEQTNIHVSKWKNICPVRSEMDYKQLLISANGCGSK